MIIKFQLTLSIILIIVYKRFTHYSNEEIDTVETGISSAGLIESDMNTCSQ